MAAEHRENLARLISDLKANAPLYSVFRAIHLAEILTKPAHPERDEEKFDQAGLRFRPHEQYVFPSRDIRTFEEKDGMMTFVLNFMGLYGIDSPLPRCYHEQVALQQNLHGAGQVPLQNFLDMFNNRLYWLYYQAWKKYRYYLQLKEEPHNRILDRIFAFIGLAPQQQKSGPSIPKFMWLRLSSILSSRIRNKEGLLLLLREFFPAVVFGLTEFVPSRARLRERPRLGKAPRSGAFQLSRYSIVGESQLDYMGRVRLEVGPISYDDYLDFIPGSRNLALLKSLMDMYLNDGLEYDIRFVVRSQTIHRLALTDRRPRLGVSYWLGRPRAELVGVFYPYERLAGTVS